MKNATLVIRNSEKFADDIWQCEEDFSRSQWKEALSTFVDALNEAYEFLDQELYDEDGTETVFGADKLYIIGDVINMLSSINVSVERGTKHEEDV